MGRRISKGDTRKTVESTGQYSRVLTERSTFLPQFRPLGESRTVVFLEGAASALSCSQTERSTKEDTPIARRAVSGFLCVCAQPMFIVLRICSHFYKLGVAVRPVLFLVPRQKRKRRLLLGL